MIELTPISLVEAYDTERSPSLNNGTLHHGIGWVGFYPFRPNPIGFWVTGWILLGHFLKSLNNVYTNYNDYYNLCNSVGFKSVVLDWVVNY